MLSQSRTVNAQPTTAGVFCCGECQWSYSFEHGIEHREARKS
eukprot:COSAG01_NODE_64590_length_276_cov_0.576271_1_plen_41_part_10